jgi:hypothetical protein
MAVAGMVIQIRSMNIVRHGSRLRAGTTLNIQERRQDRCSNRPAPSPSGVLAAFQAAATGHRLAGARSYGRSATTKGKIAKGESK